MHSITCNKGIGLKFFSGILVLLKFTLFFAILYSGALVSTNFIGLELQILGVMLYILAFVSFNKNYFSFMPLPKLLASIIIHGPYSFLRQPMYLAMLLITLPLTYEYFSFKMAVIQVSFVAMLAPIIYIEKYIW